ncbi:MAG: acylphosphatase [Gaiellaceae bacterium]
MERKRVVVHGFVQGVGFRYTVRREASRRGLAGWVRNQADGTVEAVFEGEAEDIAALVRFCDEGPRGARVERVEAVREEPEGLSDFRIS